MTKVERDLPLRFASAETIRGLTGGYCEKGHRLSANSGREPGRTVVSCEGGCSPVELLARFRRLGYRLGPMPERQRRSLKCSSAVTATTSVAFRALTPSERMMYHLIETNRARTYRSFTEDGLSRAVISVGLRALQAMGFIGVKRSPRRKGCERYGPNTYWVCRRGQGRWSGRG